MLNRNQIRKIEDIIIPKDQIQKVNEYREQHKDGWLQTTEFTHFLRRETTIEGLCCLCLSLPSKVVYFRGGFIERYCSDHLDKIKDNLEGISEHLIIKKK